MTFDEALSVVVRDAVRQALVEAPAQPKVLSLTDAARYCATSPAVIKRLILEGDLTALRVGKEYKIGVAVLESMLARGASVESGVR